MKLSEITERELEDYPKDSDVYKTLNHLHFHVKYLEIMLLELGGNVDFSYSENAEQLVENIGLFKEFDEKTLEIRAALLKKWGIL